MKKVVAIRELALVVVGTNHNPTILNPDFLRTNEIVPAEWQLAQPPLCVDIIAQVSYQNGVTLVSQPDKIVFSEPFPPGGPVLTETPGIAHRYLETVPHVDYTAVGINPKGHVSFEEEDSAQRYLAETFLANGPWLEYGDAPPRSAVKLVYAVGNARLSLTIDTGMLASDGTQTPVLFFAGNSHHDLAGATAKERHGSALEAIDAWESDLETFRGLVDGRILAEGQRRC